MLLLLLAACVPKGRHELTEVQLEATRAALSTRTGEWARAATEADARAAALQAEIDTRQLQLDELAARSALRDAELDATQERFVALLTEIEDLRAELERLRAAWPKGRAAPPPAPLEAPSLEARDAVTRALQEHFHEKVLAERLAQARAADAAAFAPLVEAGRATVEVRGTATVVRIPTALLFQEGFSTLSPRGRLIARQVADALRRVPGREVTIEGHTDRRPVHSAEFPSNWERGFSHAVALLHALEAAKAPAQLSARSFGGTRPLDPGDGPEADERNRRLELVLEVDVDLVVAFPPGPPTGPLPPEPEPPAP